MRTGTQKRLWDKARCK